jgi:uncharacterized OB-fold protein
MAEPSPPAPTPHDEEIPLPRLEPDNAVFWTMGSSGTLHIPRCRVCGTYWHPPIPRCLVCGSREINASPVSGRATVYTFTVNHQPFMPSMPPRYVIAIVELPEQEGLEFTTRIVDCDPDDVFIGMAVSVRFEQHGEVFLPLFAPERGGE